MSGQDGQSICAAIPQMQAPITFYADHHKAVDPDPLVPQPGSVCMPAGCAVTQVGDRPV